MTPRDIMIQDAFLRTIAFFDVIDYAPSWSEASAWIEWGEGITKQSSSVERVCTDRQGMMPHDGDFPVPSSEELSEAKDALVRSGRVEEGMGRIALRGRLGRLLALSFDRMPAQARKLRRARRVATMLSRLGAVRFVALVNTTALANARDAADLDFFIIARSGRLWTTRLFAAGPYRAFGKLSRPDANPDAVCLSYFISDANLDLSSHMLAPDDPYFRYWFLSMLPLYDDGIGEDLWKANDSLRARHPRALRWRGKGDRELAIEKKRNIQSLISNLQSHARLPFPSRLEYFSRAIQMRWFPAQIRARMNADTSVIVSESALKFHVDDARHAFRDAYEQRLVDQGIGVMGQGSGGVARFLTHDP